VVPYLQIIRLRAPIPVVLAVIVKGAQATKRVEGRMGRARLAAVPNIAPIRLATARLKVVPFPFRATAIVRF
jgi:hypothetical protein